MTTPTRDDRDMNDAVHSWLHENDEPTPDRNRHIGRIMGRVDETKQRRRLWPLNPFGRRAMHSATGTEGATPVSGRRTAALAPLRVMTAAVLALLVTTALVWVAARPLQDGPTLPPGWQVDPAHETLFEGWVALWAGEETDLDTTREVYAEDVVRTVLGLDDVERVSGTDDIHRQMLRSEAVDRSDQQLIRLPGYYSRTGRYLLVWPSFDGRACVIFVEGERIARHDCILASAVDDEPSLLQPVDSSMIAEREALMEAFRAAQDADDRAALEKVVSPEIVHHTRSDNQYYTLEGLDEYEYILQAPPQPLATVDLPAPAGNLRWANFSTVGGGTLCVFWAQDGLITRHDCVLPGPSTLPSSLLDPIDG